MRCVAHCITLTFMCAVARNAYESRRIAELAEAGSRTVKAVRCPQCDAECLRGDDHDACSVKATVDIEPIDRLAESLAIIDGLATYDIAKQKGKASKAGAFVLYYREPWHYESETVKHPILVQHKCERGTR